MTTPAAPQSATPPAPADGQPTAPAATPPVPGPPANAPAVQPQDNRDMAAAPTTPAGDAPKTFTQEDLDRILTDRMGRFEKSLNQKFAQALGITDPNAPVDPAAALQAAQQQAEQAQQRADLADARSLAALAGVSPDHVETFLKLVDLGPLKDVDRTNAAAVSAAVKGAVDNALTAAPMFKGGALPAASGGDRQAPANGKRTYTRAELESMDQGALSAIADDLQAAAREGRILG